MGTVYRAHDDRLDRDVALKVLALEGDGDTVTDSELRARLMREGRAAAKLDHPNAVVVYDVGEVDGTPFIAMELVEGHTLREVLQQGIPPREDAVRWLGDVALALDHAHERGIVHRDVKPENVMVRPDGRIKVLDFGIARRLAGPVDPDAPTASPALPTLTVEGTLVGTTRYMSPEQVRGTPLDGRSDQFAWGTMAYELLTGRLPWRGSDPLAISASLLTDTPPRLADDGVPSPLARVVERALDKDPDKRFESMQAAAEALERAARGEAPPAREAGAGPAQSVRPATSRAGREFASYSTEQVSEILKRAVDVQASRGSGLSHDELAEVAGEVGVDRAALDQAVRDLAHRTDDPRRAQLARLKSQALRYMGIAVLLFWVALLTHGWGWFWWALIGLGAALMFRGIRVVTGEESERDRRRDRRRGRRNRRPDESEIARGVDLLLEATARRRVRADERVRVAAEADELEAEPGSAPPRRARRD